MPENISHNCHLPACMVFFSKSLLIWIKLKRQHTNYCTSAGRTDGEGARADEGRVEGQMGEGVETSTSCT